MKFVRKPGSSGLFCFCKRVLPQVVAREILALPYFYRPMQRSVPRTFNDRRKEFVAGVGRPRFANSNSYAAGLIQERRRVTLFRRAKKNALA
ncbi:MAG TPA: hypothetical protein VIJ35_10620 [Bradyrhizobium sp.]|jgi:hypothetical protein